MNLKIILEIVITCTVLVLAGCSAQSMQVSMATPVAQNSSQSEKYVVVSNCGTLEELHRSLAEEAQVSITVTVDDPATAVDTGEKTAIPEATQKQIISKIEAAYQPVIAEAKATVEQTILTIPGQRVYHFYIKWKRQSYLSEITFNLNGKPYSTQYTCAVDTPEASMSAQLICTG